MVKKVIVLLTLFVLSTGSFYKRCVYTEKDIECNFLFSFYCLFDLEDVNSQNFVLNTSLLKNIFFETIYTILVKEDLRSFQTILEELKRPFVNFWIISNVAYLVLNEVVYVFFELKKHFEVPTVVSVVTFLFVFLFYFKLYLKTYKPILLVLRC